MSASVVSGTACSKISRSSFALKLKIKNGIVLPGCFESSNHFRQRQEDRNISDPLVVETLQYGRIMDTRESRNRENREDHSLHVADHVIVVTVDSVDAGSRRSFGVTTYRNELSGPWSAVSNSESEILQLDTTHLFFQVILHNQNYSSDLLMRLISKDLLVDK